MLDKAIYEPDSTFLSALVVDDESLVAEFLAETLEDMGFAVMTAATVAQALETTRTNGKFSVAFIDLGLPDRSGLELISELQTLYPGLPVVIASGYGSMASRDMVGVGSDTHCLSILSKPYDAKVVARVINELGIKPPQKV